MNEAFEEALKQREKRKKREENKSSSYEVKDFEEIHWLGLEKKGHTAIRLLGNPLEFRQQSTDIKLVYRSKIVSHAKENSYFYVNWKQTTETRKGFEFDSGELDKKWILHRFLNSVQAVEWIKVEGKEKKQKNFLNANTSTFKEVENNKILRDSNNPYANKFYPSKVVMANVIDPSNLDWHKESKHSRLIASKLEVVDTQDKSVKIVYPTPGLPYSVYSSIMDNLASKVGGIDFDVVIKRDVDADPMYLVSYFSDLAVPIEIKSYCSDKNYSDLNLTLYDLDNMYPVTSYSKLKYHLLPLFKKWDKESGSNFAEELEELAEEESSKKESEKKQETKVVPVQSNPIEEPKKERSRTPKSEKKEVSVESFFPKLNEIDKEDQEWFYKTFSHIENDKAVWKKVDDEGEKVQLVPCDHCHTELSSKLLQCPACGKSLE
jgi:hypothetical protein